MTKKSNGEDVEVLRPLKHRPGVIVVKSNGTLKVIGDGNPFFTNAEFIALHGGLAPSTTPRLEYSESEQLALDEAEVLVTRAAALFDEILAESQLLTERMYRTRDQDEVVVLKSNSESLKARKHEVRELYQDALVERNKLQRRIQAAAIARQRPPQYHTQSKTTEQRLADLEDRK